MMEKEKFIITINREFGSGGREIACKVAELLGVKFYDKEILSVLTEKYDLSVEEMERIKAKKTNWWSEFCRFYSQNSSVASYTGGRQILAVNREISSIELFKAEEKILKELADQESCVILGRTGFHIFKDYPNAMRLMLIANHDFRLKRIMDKYNLDEKKAEEKIQEVDTARENFTKTFAKVSRYDARNYDMVMNVSGFSTDAVADFIAKNVRLKYPEN